MSTQPVTVPTSTTIQLFENAGGPTAAGSRSNPHDWFLPENVENGTTIKRVREFIAIGRHQGSVANYLFLDGHVAALPSKQIEVWAQEGHNFMLPGRAIVP